MESSHFLNQYFKVWLTYQSEINITCTVGAIQKISSCMKLEQCNERVKINTPEKSNILRSGEKENLIQNE